MKGREFDSIRPYNDEQTREALKRIAKAPEIKQVCKFMHGSGLDEDSLRMLLCSLNGIDDFQVKVMATVVRMVIAKTTKGILFSKIKQIIIALFLVLSIVCVNEWSLGGRTTDLSFGTFSKRIKIY